jgi:hypothetical protein
MFDDPNLHGERYGYLHFPSLAAAARRDRFHVAVATVPLDQYRVSPRAARTFRDSADVLSLLVHGIDHLPRELAAECPGAGATARVRRGLRQIETLERRAEVRVARVMAPPHGAFSTGMMRACAGAGFEAACVSWGAIWSSNRALAWTEGLGAAPGRLIRGCRSSHGFAWLATSRARFCSPRTWASPSSPSGTTGTSAGTPSC